MKVFIVSHEVPYEFGEVIGVFSSLEKAEADKCAFIAAGESDEENVKIKEWEVA